MIIEDLSINMMVKNEERYIRETLRSVLPFVDKGIIIDTGSTDKTVEYIFELIKDKKDIEFEVRPVTGDSIHWNGNHLSQELTIIRNLMLDRVKTKWVWQVDGDEIYTPSAIADLRLALAHIEHNNDYKGVMVPIRWCTSNTEYVLPGPFNKTLRVMPNDGRWVGEFPNEFLYVDGLPITIHDPRCISTSNPFLHMSMALHPERRPPNGKIIPLSPGEVDLINPFRF